MFSNLATCRTLLNRTQNTSTSGKGIQNSNFFKQRVAPIKRNKGLYTCPVELTIIHKIKPEKPFSPSISLWAYFRTSERWKPENWQNHCEIIGWMIYRHTLLVSLFTWFTIIDWIRCSKDLNLVISVPINMVIERVTTFWILHNFSTKIIFKC